MDIHVVRPGDTLYSIAQQYGVSMARLLEDNDPPDPARLSVGQTLVVRYPKKVYRCLLYTSHIISTLTNQNPGGPDKNRFRPEKLIVSS